MLFLAIFVDGKKKKCYYDCMSRKILTNYSSQNGIFFHHSVTVQEYEKQDELLPESHHMCEIILLLNGSVEYKVEGQIYNLSPLDAIIIHPNKLHSREINPEKPYERMVLHFSPDLLPSFADLNLLSGYSDSYLPSVLPKKIIEKTNFIELMRECKGLCEQDSKYTDLRLIGVILKIVETLNEVILSLDEENHPRPIKVDKISHACIRYVNQHLCEREKLSPQNIARELHISVSHLQHTFKKEIGVSLHDYVANQRIQLARKLLLQGESPQSAANILGYEYYSTFYHNFVKRFGVTPNSFTEIQNKSKQDI